MPLPLPRPFTAGLKVLVMAGSDPPRAGESGAGREAPLRDKSFLTLRGRLVVEYVLDQLTACGLTRTWILASPANLERLGPRSGLVHLPQVAGAGFSADVTTAAAATDPQPGEPILVVFGDHPLETPQALRAFLADCGRQIDTADFFHALAVRSAYLEYAAWSQRTSMHSREVSGRATGFTLIVPSRVHRLAALGELYAVRKLERWGSLAGLIWRLMRWLGPDVPRGVLDALVMSAAKEMEKKARGRGRVGRVAGRLESWLAARVRLARLERYAARVLGAERGVRIIPVAHGGMALDVDFAEELAALERNWDAIQAVSRRQEARLAEGCDTMAAPATPGTADS